MADKYAMDGHKLHLHPARVRDWLDGERIAPLHIDVGLSRGCNIRCEYCFGAMQGNLYEKGTALYFPREPLLRYVREAGEIGVRSMALIGEAEPLLNPHVYEAIVRGKQAGVDMALATNGILFDTGKDGEAALEHLSWLRFNISAATDAAYRQIHRSGDFAVALEKIRFCVAAKRRKNLPVTIGLQMVLTLSNSDQILPLARLGLELGVDYLVIKQCSDSVENTLGVFARLNDYDRFAQCLAEAEDLSSGGYNVIVKWHKLTNLGKRRYDACLGAPFLLYSSGAGKLYPCGMFFDGKHEEYCMGDLTKASLAEIVASPAYWQVVDKVQQIDVHKVCYANCRTHAINEYLWSLRHPPAHVNFI
ncbi:MAG: radical SAM protein [Deltaproteobacteria bacterium RIFOXYD12_FULL_57_12]|nr:MAG: radical SAM protein [Deltaproteobacteria bacterium RIFOXYD12_FULL_57_12]